MTHSQQTNLLMAGIVSVAVFYATESQAVDINVPKITVAPTTLAKLPKSVIDLAKVKAPAPTTITVPVMPRPATTMTVAPALKATSPAIQAALQKIRKIVPQATAKSKAALAVSQRHTPVIANVAAAVRQVPSGRSVDAKAIERVQQVDKRLLGGKLLQVDLAKNVIVALPEQVQGKAQRPDPVSGALPAVQKPGHSFVGLDGTMTAVPTGKPVVGAAGVDFANRTVGGLQDPKQQTLAVYNNDPAAIAMARNAWISLGSDDSTGKFLKQVLSTTSAIAAQAPGPVGAVGKAVSSTVSGVSAAEGVAEDRTQGLIDLGVSQATTLGPAALEAGAAMGAVGAAGAAAGSLLASAGAGYALGRVLDEALGINEALKEAAKPDDATNVRGLNPGHAGATGTGTGSQPAPATDPESGSQPTGAETSAADTDGGCNVNMSCPDDPPDDADQSGAGGDDESDEGDSSASDDGDASADASDDGDASADASDEDDPQPADTAEDTADDTTTEDEEEDTYCGAQQDDCGGPTLTVEEMEAWGIIARDTENWDKTPNPEADPVETIDPTQADGLMAAAVAQKLGLVTTPNPEDNTSPMPPLTEEEQAEYQRQMRERRLAPLVYPSPMDD